MLRINLKLDPILGAHIVKFFCAAIEREISSEYSIHNEVHAIILYSLLCISKMINSRNIFFYQGNKFLSLKPKFIKMIHIPGSNKTKVILY